jgi:hypothetical protein
MFEHDFGQTDGCRPTTYGVAKDELNDAGVFCIDRMSFTFTGVLEGRKLFDAEYWCLETPPPSPTGQRYPQLAGRWTGGWYNLGMTSTDSSGADRSWPCRLVGGRGMQTMTLTFGAGEGRNDGIGPAWIDVIPEGSSLRHRLNGDATISVTDQSIYDVRAGNLSMTLQRPAG